METPGELTAMFDALKDRFGATSLYLVDVEEQEDRAPRAVLGVRGSRTPEVLARAQAEESLRAATAVPVSVVLLSEPLEEVEYLFDRYLRAYIASHGGAVTPVRADEGAGRLWIRMDGGCSGCPSSLATLKHGIERTLKEHLPWVSQVEAVNEPAEPDFAIRLDLAAAGIREEA